MASHKDFPFGPPPSDDRDTKGNTIIVRGGMVWSMVDGKGVSRVSPHTHVPSLDALLWWCMDEEH